MKCPLCESLDTPLQSSFDVLELANCWERDFKLDVRAEFLGAPTVTLHRCNHCALQFFKPDSVAGSVSLYEGLEKIDWYYQQRKWEHDVALEDIGKAGTGVEIGCGRGAFIARVTREKSISFTGCELNPSAVEAAVSRGLAVTLEDAESLANRNPGAYDVVCSFQVLEHVIHPRSLLQSMCKLLRPGGRLLLGLPNADSFLKYEFNLLDMPPHHMTRWNAEALKELPVRFPLRLVRLAYEPLDCDQLDRHISAHAQFLRERKLGVLASSGARALAGGLLRRSSAIRRLLRGQTFYACYVRT